MNNYILENYKEKSKHSFVQQYVRNVCAKFTVDPLSHFHTGACQVFTTQKLSSSEILLLEVSIKFPLNTFSDKTTICQISFDIKQINT